MRKFAILIFIFIFVFSLLGSGKEIDTLGIVSGMAFDKSEKPIDISVCFLKANGAGGVQGEEGEAFFVASVKSDTFEKAKADISLKAEREPFFGHNDMIFVERDADIENILHQLYSDSDTRGSELVVICRDKASDVFKADNFMGDISTVSISEILQFASEKGNIEKINIHDLVYRMNKPSACCLVPVGESNDSHFEFLGMGIIKDYIFKGLLSEKEKTGAMLLSGKSFLYTAEINGEAYKSRLISADTEFKNGRFEISLYLELESGSDKKIFENYIKSCIRAAVSRAYKSRCDFLGFADEYFRKTGMKKYIFDIDTAIDIKVERQEG